MRKKMIELPNEESEKEFERLIDKFIDILDDNPYHPLPLKRTPEEIRARNKAFKKISDEHLHT